MSVSAKEVPSSAVAPVLALNCAKISGTTSKVKGLGYATGAQFSASTGATALDGTSFADTDIIVRYTLLGDATMDGQVTIADFLALQNNFNKTGKTWEDGDFNYDGSVT